jgi:hypothetical protein
MWVRTPTNDLCNLSHARRIVLSRDPITKKHDVRAWFAGDDEPVVLAEYESEDDARQHMRGLVLLVGARKCELTKGESK